MNTTSEAWEQIFRHKNFDVSRDLHFITADEIKEITRKEPRILAKVDFSRDLPDVLKRNGYFLLPVNNGKYAIVRGDGFHALETEAQVEEFESKIDFPLTTAGRGQSEMQYLDHAFNTGVLASVLRQGTLYQSIRGRERSKKFSFNVNTTNIDVDAVQIEVDSGMEAKEAVILMEAKIGRPADFIIRQLFYPYRNFKLISPKKTIIPAFLTYDLGSSTYGLKIYRFANDEDYNSIELVENLAFKIRTANAIKLGDIRPTGIVNYRDVIPQANKIDRIIEFVFRVSEGVNNARAMADHFGFDIRQSHYYRSAAEALGLVSSSEGNYELTDVGKEFVNLDVESRNIFVANLLADFHVVRAAFELLQSGKTVSFEQLLSIVSKGEKISGATVKRRALSLASWLGWIGEHTGAIKLTDAGYSM